MKYTLFLLFILTSCAKVSYIVDQGIGQISLEYNDEDVDDFLNDPKIDPKYKEKVKVISKAKKYFYNYFELEQTAIYDEVKILDQPAVTYLVIHSPQNQIKALETTFPIVGSFPYLGFFSKKKAFAYVNDLQKIGYATYMRPVYAYSTLNHPLWPFHDNILSSFFYYKDEELTELIFHELVHTVFFVKDQIKVNENIAEFISEKLVKEYYGWSEDEILKRVKKHQINIDLRNAVIMASKDLTKKYLNSDNYSEILTEYLSEKFYPNIKEICHKHALEQCWPLKGKWNNARFAAFNTYTSERDAIDKIFKRSNLTLKTFLHQLIKYEKEYKNKEEFLKYLERKI